MNKLKKTALDLACSDLMVKITNCEFDCPAKSLCTKDKTRDLFRCKAVLKKYYKQQADIPDGWDVVKDKYLEYAKKYDKLLEKYNFLDKTNGFKNEESRKFMRIELNSYADKANVLGDIMKEAGIEVDNDTN